MDTRTHTQLDQIVSELVAGAARWATTGLTDRIEVLRRVHRATATSLEPWTSTAADIKLLSPDSPLVGEEWTAGPYAFLNGLDALIVSLTALADGRGPIDRVRLGRAPGGRVSVPVMPVTTSDRLLFNGFRADVWLEAGVDADTARAEAGLGARLPDRSGGVGLVLGAGNITSIAPLDVLYELIAHNRAVVLKTNPILARLTPILAAALEPLVAYGVLRIVDGDGEVGEYLAFHPDVAHVHITGSLTTHDVVAFGPGARGRERKESSAPRLTKPMSSELGGVAPVIVVPGRWSRADLRFQAEHVATQRLHTAGHTCVSSQVLVLSSDWPQREEFLDELRRVLDDAPARRPWYPGAARRLQRLADTAGSVERRGIDGDRLLLDLDHGDPLDFRRTEAFASALGIRTLPGTGEQFLTAAIEFANDELMGTLGAGIVIHPHDERRLGRPLDELLEPLRYGTIGVNAWSGVGFFTPRATWGAYPGHTLADAQSGIGIVHNAYLLARTERTVVRGPFRPFPRSVLRGEPALSPTPPWFITARSAAVTGRRITAYAAQPSAPRLFGVIAAAVRA